MRVLSFLGLHALLALLMYRVPALATLHAIATVAFGLWWARPPYALERAAVVAAYITGAEVLWRMLEARIPWEAGKYGLVLICLAALRRTGRLNCPPMALFYFVLLLPSCLLPLSMIDFLSARNEVSFNLSGPFTLMVATWIFSHLRLSWPQVQRVVLAFLAPAVSMASVALLGIVTSPDLNFGSESNLAASGGFGPNQVSAIFGLAALMALFCVVNDRSSWQLRVALFGLMAMMAAQSAITFSRGGLYNAGAAAIVATLFWLGDRRSRGRIGMIAALLLLLALYVLIPRLNAFTGGALVNRFENTSVTGRDRLVAADLHAWRENPLFGVGPGMAKRLHAEMFVVSSAHTEFSRMLAEHGTLGLVSLLLLLATAGYHLRRTRSARGKAVVGSLLCWALLFMNGYAMRLAAPAFIFGLTAVTFSDEASARRRPRNGSTGTPRDGGQRNSPGRGSERPIAARSTRAGRNEPGATDDSRESRSR